MAALGWACLKGRVQAAQCLLDQGSDLAGADTKGRSPLFLAAYKGDPEVVQVSGRAPPCSAATEPTGKIKTLLHLQLLLDRGAQMESADANGMRPLDRAISSGHAGAVQCFLKKGAKLGPATWALAGDKHEIMWVSRALYAQRCGFFKNCNFGFRLILLNKLLEDGNTLYRKNRFEDAAHRYQYAIKRIPAEDQGSKDGKEMFEQLKVHLFLNLSRCKRKQGLYAEAVQLASVVLSFRPNSLEAMHARARAYRLVSKMDSVLH